MSEANIIFILDCQEVTIQCSTNDKLKNICQKYTFKIQKNIDSFNFLYNGNLINFELTFNEQATSSDKENKKMTVLVYKKITGFVCPKCGEEIKINTEIFNNLKEKNDNIINTLVGIKSQLENIIKTSSGNPINNQLNNINIILNSISEDIKKCNETIDNIISNDIDIFIKNTITNKNVNECNDIVNNNLDKNNMNNNNMINNNMINNEIINNNVINNNMDKNNMINNNMVNNNMINNEIINNNVSNSINNNEIICNNMINNKINNIESNNSNNNEMINNNMVNNNGSNNINNNIINNNTNNIDKDNLNEKVNNMVNNNIIKNDNDDNKINNNEIINNNMSNNIIKDKIINNADIVNNKNVGKNNLSSDNQVNDNIHSNNKINEKEKNNDNINFNNNTLSLNNGKKNESQNPKEIQKDILENKQITNSEKVKEEIPQNIDILKRVLSILIDSVKMKRMISKQSKKSDKDENKKYYFLNYLWFKDYIHTNKIDEIFDILEKNVQEYLSKEKNISLLNNNLIISKIINNLDTNIINHIQENFFVSNYNCEAILNSLSKYNNLKIFFYTNLILISSETLNYFPNKLIKNRLASRPVYFFDNKIAIKFPKQNINIIDIYEFENYYISNPIMILEFKNGKELTKNFNILNSIGLEKYKKNYLLLDEDEFFPPIKDESGNKIGSAFAYNEKIKDYSIFIPKEVIINSLIQLYFINYKLKASFYQNRQKKYFIFNSNFLKEFNSYIEAKLNHLSIKKELNLNKIKDINDFNEFFTSKKIINIIKKIISKSENKIIPNKFKSNEVSDIKPFIFNNTEIFYFVNFNLVNISLIQILEDNNIKLYKNKCDHEVECWILDKYILIDISNKNNNNNYEILLEICTLNENNIIKPIYLLCYFIRDDFPKYINYLLKNLEMTFTRFLESLSFPPENRIKLENESNIEIGIIFKLSEECPNKNQINENNDINIYNNINSNNNINPNINIFISNNHLINSNSSNYLINNIQPQININYIQNITTIKSIEEEFQQSPLVGLKNIGANRYMNATLQCLCNIKEFVNFFKYKLKDEEINKFKSENKWILTINFKYLIENLWPSKENNNYINLEYNNQNSNHKYFNPLLFVKNITDMYPSLNNVNVKDAHDLIKNLLFKLHEELNMAPKMEGINSQNIYPHQDNKYFSYIKFIENFKNENDSLIIDLFNGINYNVTKCSNCNLMKYNFLNYFFLFFDIGKIMNYKIHQDKESNQLNQNFPNETNNLLNSQQNFKIYSYNIENINSVNLEDCFRYMQYSEELSDQYNRNCNNCNSVFSLKDHKKFYIGPEILILIISNEINIECKYKCEFNLDDFIENKNTGCKYDLISMVSYKEEKLASGHFIAFCKSSIDSLWYEYDDELVLLVDDVIEAFNKAIPHVLFYKKKN